MGGGKRGILTLPSLVCMLMGGEGREREDWEKRGGGDFSPVPSFGVSVRGRGSDSSPFGVYVDWEKEERKGKVFPSLPLTCACHGENEEWKRRRKERYIPKGEWEQEVWEEKNVGTRERRERTRRRRERRVMKERREGENEKGKRSERSMPKFLLF